MRTIKQLTNNKFLNIFEAYDEQYHVKGYQFAERRGVDSVAFIGYDKNIRKFLINEELKLPVGKFIKGSFGGSFDKDKGPKQIVIDECEEEAGFKVTAHDVEYVGKVFVSTQMNQYCYLYLVNIVQNKQEERKPENKIEALAKLYWVELDEIYELEDWKAITILTLAQIQGII